VSDLRDGGVESADVEAQTVRRRTVALVTSTAAVAATIVVAHGEEREKGRWETKEQGQKRQRSKKSASSPQHHNVNLFCCSSQLRDS
jgi:hypothetical protein